MLSSLGGELRDMPTKGLASCKPLRSLWRPSARSVAFKQYRQPGCLRVEWDGGGEAAGRKKQQPLLSWTLHQQPPPPSYFLEMWPRASYHPLSREPRLPGTRVTPRQMWVRAGVPSPGPALTLHGVLSQGRVGLNLPFHFSHHSPSWSAGS